MINMYDDATKMTKDMMDSSLKSIAIMSKGFQQLAAETQDYTKRAYEHQASYFENLMQAKSLDKSMEIQSEFAKSAYQEWVAQATKLGEIYADTAKEAYKPLEASASTVAEKSRNVAEKSVTVAETAAEKATAPKTAN
ncbi:phasin family protein [Fulvimarina sp. 2208YS6-2-32]|uniref:Phasin family protein n=1 Tax=Fulvimarina uroteuthidis TaxID=3098149 RepID=A0ABU5I434_9HYPH|nr:phasin family protein [Fulvimarina sp. 2208YS6-2-32]MDY8109857.1 phasin family protein [Fulvimarina sp. 2208YS6-2-32]